MINIIPKPNYIEKKDGEFLIKDVNYYNDFVENDEFIKEAFIENNIEINASMPANFYFYGEKGLDNEEYRIEITTSKVSIFASTKAGSFYGLQSIRQLLISNNKKLDCLIIKDKPRFKYRSFMLDESRHFFGKDVVKEMLDLMAILKLNHFHWHLTDDQGWRVEIEKYPLLTTKGSIRKSTQKAIIGQVLKGSQDDNVEYGRNCYYTKDDLKEIVEYAAKRNIEICPEVDMPGHLTAAISCYPELSCKGENIDVAINWGIHKIIGCAGKEVLYTFVKDVIKELSEVFPSGYFHIGGDEAPKDEWKECELCQKKIKGLGLKDEQALQGYFNNQIVDYLKSLGKRTIAWNEILKSGTTIDETIIQYWIGDPNKNHVNEWLEKGNNIIISYCPYLYMDYPYTVESIKKSYNTDLDKVKIDRKYENQILGFEAPLWSEYVKDKGKLEYQVLPRLMSLSEINWTNSESKDFNNFIDRVEEFNKYLDRYSIKHASKYASNPIGIKGFFRLLRTGYMLLFNPDLEYDKYCK